MVLVDLGVYAPPGEGKAEGRDVEEEVDVSVVFFLSRRVGIGSLIWLLFFLFFFSFCFVVALLLCSLNRGRGRDIQQDEPLNVHYTVKYRMQHLNGYKPRVNLQKPRWVK